MVYKTEISSHHRNKAIIFNITLHLSFKE